VWGRPFNRGLRDEAIAHVGIRVSHQMSDYFNFL